MSDFKCCLDCPRRKISCHSTCPDYIKEKEKHDATEKEKRSKEINDYRVVIHKKKEHIKFTFIYKKHV